MHILTEEIGPSLNSDTTIATAGNQFIADMCERRRRSLEADQLARAVNDAASDILAAELAATGLPGISADAAAAAGGTAIDLLQTTNEDLYWDAIFDSIDYRYRYSTGVFQRLSISETYISRTSLPRSVLLDTPAACFAPHPFSNEFQHMYVN